MILLDTSLLSVAFRHRRQAEPEPVPVSLLRELIQGKAKSGPPDTPSRAVVNCDSMQNKYMLLRPPRKLASRVERLAAGLRWHRTLARPVVVFQARANADYRPLSNLIET
ncbi:MAG: hypothetical protein AAB368_15000, partial [bacterium]